MSLPRYESYKDSGVEWLGKVPEHWEVYRLKWSIDYCKNGVWGDEPKQDENDIPCVRVADFDRNKLQIELIEPTIRNVLPKDRNLRVLEKGNLLLEKSGGGENQPVGCVVLYDVVNSAVCSNFVAKIQMAYGMISSYWRYVHASAYAVRLTTRSINQTSGIQNLDQDSYFNELAVFPPIIEQNAIAQFLDQETAKIDNLIGEQQLLIKLLKEKRQAVISHAVTKGLNPNVPMKNSGVEWLGEVPEHWRNVKLKTYISTRKGAAFKAEFFCTEGVRVVKASDIKDFSIRESEVFLPLGFLDQYTNAILRHGDIVISTVGSTPDVKNSAVGQLAKIPKNIDGALLNQNTVVFSINEISKLDNNFLFLLLQTSRYRDHLDINAHGTANQASLNISDMLDFVITIPTLEEQKIIAQFIDQETTKIDNLSSEAIDVISLLKERRSALISSAVTGKIDVRNYVPSQSQVEAMA